MSLERSRETSFFADTYADVCHPHGRGLKKKGRYGARHARVSMFERGTEKFFLAQLLEIEPDQHLNCSPHIAEAPKRT